VRSVAVVGSRSSLAQPGRTKRNEVRDRQVQILEVPVAKRIRIDNRVNDVVHVDGRADDVDVTVAFQFRAESAVWIARQRVDANLRETRIQPQEFAHRHASERAIVQIETSACRDRIHLHLGSAVTAVAVVSVSVSAAIFTSAVFIAAVVASAVAA
jgi:hypothetical protein